MVLLLQGSALLLLANDLVVSHRVGLLVGRGWCSTIDLDWEELRVVGLLVERGIIVDSWKTLLEDTSKVITMWALASYASISTIVLIGHHTSGRNRKDLHAHVIADATFVWHTRLAGDHVDRVIVVWQVREVFIHRRGLLLVLMLQCVWVLILEGRLAASLHKRRLRQTRRQADLGISISGPQVLLAALLAFVVRASQRYHHLLLLSVIVVVVDLVIAARTLLRRVPVFGQIVITLRLKRLTYDALALMLLHTRDLYILRYQVWYLPFFFLATAADCYDGFVWSVVMVHIWKCLVSQDIDGWSV